MWRDWQEIGWRPDKLDLAALHEAWGASKKQSNADLHLYCWMNFGKASTKELTYQEYGRAVRYGNNFTLVAILRDYTEGGELAESYSDNHQKLPGKMHERQVTENPSPARSNEDD